MPSPGRASRFLLLVPLVTALAIGASLLPLAGGSANAAEPLRPRVTDIRTLNHEVYGYLPYWNLDSGTARRLRYELVTTIAFFALPIRGDGNLDRRAAGYRAYVGKAAADVTNAAHAQGVRVVPTFQLFDSGKLRTLRAFLGSGSAQKRFIQQALAVMAARQADGASLDVEPVPMSLTRPYLAFVRRFASAVHARFRGATVVNATAPGADVALIRGLVPLVDRQLIMAYDYRTGRSGTAGPVAPLVGEARNVTRHVERFLRHAPAARLILGVGYYGYSWPVTSNKPKAVVRRDVKRFGPVRGVSYAGARAFLAGHPKVRPVVDRTSGGAYFTYWDPTYRTWRQVWYEDARSLAAKYDFAKARGLAGVGIWTLDNDRGYGDLWSVLQSRFYAPIHRLAVAGSASRVTRTAGGIVRATVRWSIRNAGTVPERGTLRWTVRDRRGRVVAHGSRTLTLRPGQTAGTATRTTLGRSWRLAAGRYAVSVRFVVGATHYDSRRTSFRQPY
jgi:spore germination protein YaaH